MEIMLDIWKIRQGNNGSLKFFESFRNAEKLDFLTTKQIF